jgi:hypothetical protein
MAFEVLLNDDPQFLSGPNESRMNTLFSTSNWGHFSNLDTFSSRLIVCRLARIRCFFMYWISSFGGKAISMSTGSKVQGTFRLLEGVKKHFKGFYEKCAEKKTEKQ